MGALRRCKEDYFVWATLLVVLELLICGRVMGSCRDGMEESTDDHHYNGHGGQNLEFVSHDDDHSHHGSGHSQCHGHGDHHHHHHHHHHKQAHDHGYFPTSEKFKLPEELEEEEDLRLYGFDSQYSVHGEEHAHADDRLSTTGLWVRAMGSSLLVSMASLICLMIIPVIVLQGKPSKTVVDSLAAFGAGAMLGDAFLHQLPHALGGSGKHSHSHSHSLDHGHNHNHIHSHSHASIDFHAESHSHSLEELAVGLAALAGIILFFLVEKIVRYVEELSAQGVQVFHHGHHHHHKSTVPSKKHEGHDHGNTTLDHGESGESDQAHEVKSLDATADSDAVDGKENWADTNLRKRRNTNGADKVGKEIAKSRDTSSERLGTSTEQSMPTSASNLVLGYLNLFSDGVHNFTDGMALGSAFLLHGSVGGWSRTLFLLAHELPQEIGDFGILVSSGFGVFKALLFNFLSALVALAGTALALLIGEDPGHSSWIEGFTAGGFIYIALAGVLPEMHQKGASFRSTLLQLMALTLGMGVALCISLWE